MNGTRNKKPSFRTTARWNTVSVPAHVAERAHNRHSVNEDGCWVSTYSTASHGYAQIGWGIPVSERVPGGPRNRGALAHRASWTHVHGQVPIGMTLDHLCKNRRCVNPAHLRLLSNYENARRNTGDDWGFGTCRNGHPDTELEESLRTAKSGRKYFGLRCRVCMNESRKKWEERNPEKVRAIREAYKPIARAKYHASARG